MIEPKRYRHLPTVTTQMRWDGTIESANAILAWIEPLGHTGQPFGPGDRTDNKPYIAIDTADGGAVAVTMDRPWVVLGVEDRLYAITDGVHHQSYEEDAEGFFALLDATEKAWDDFARNLKASVAALDALDKDELLAAWPRVQAARAHIRASMP